MRLSMQCDSGGARARSEERALGLTPPFPLPAGAPHKSANTATMKITLCVFVLVTSSAAACSSNLDCSLNGLCVSGACQCDKPWTGNANCSIITRVAARPGGIYGYDPNVSSWGGNPVLGDDSKVSVQQEKRTRINIMCVSIA